LIISDPTTKSKANLCDEVYRHREKIKHLLPGSRFKHLRNAMTEHRDKKMVIFCEMYVKVVREIYIR